MSNFEIPTDIDRTIRDQEYFLKNHEAEYEKYKCVVRVLKRILTTEHIGPIPILFLARYLRNNIKDELKDYENMVENYKYDVSTARERLQHLYDIKKYCCKTKKGGKKDE